MDDMIRAALERHSRPWRVGPTHAYGTAIEDAKHRAVVWPMAIPGAAALIVEAVNGYKAEAAAKKGRKA